MSEDDAAALRSLGIDLDAIRDAVERQFGEGALDEPTQDATPRRRPHGDLGEMTHDAWAARGRFRRGGHIRFGRGSKKVLELSLREAIRAGAREIRTEHIALGVLRTDDEATMLMRTLGVDVRAVRADLEDRAAAPPEAPCGSAPERVRRSRGQDMPVQTAHPGHVSTPRRAVAPLSGRDSPTPAAGRHPRC